MSIAILSNSLNELYDNLSSQLIQSTAENIIIFILVAMVIFIIISTPAVLFYFSIDNYFKIKKLKSVIDNNICCRNSKTHASSDEKKVCSQYINNYSLFVGNVSGLIIWNLLSLIYIFTQFSNTTTGIISYFKFPFEVLNSLDFNNVLTSIATYKSSWIFMISIFSLTYLAYLLAKIITPIFINKTLNDNINNYKTVNKRVYLGI